MWPIGSVFQDTSNQDMSEYFLHWQQRLWMKMWSSLGCVSIFIYYSCHNKVGQAGWQTTKMYCLIVLKGRRPRSRRWQDWALLRTLSLACRWGLLVSSHGLPAVHLCPNFLSYKTSSHILYLDSPEWPFNHLFKASISKYSPTEVLSVRILIYAFVGDTTQLATVTPCLSFQISPAVVNLL